MPQIARKCVVEAFFMFMGVSLVCIKASKKNLVCLSYIFLCERRDFPNSIEFLYV